jgi:hypothetical protein
MENLNPISFAIIAEGVTDQIVIKNILQGIFGLEGTFIMVNNLQPLNNSSDINSPGGWTLTLDYLKNSEKLKDALNYNDFIVINIDTDRSPDPGFDVSHYKDGVELDQKSLINNIINHLRTIIDKDVLSEIEDKMIFAIPVHSIECWLLHLHCPSEIYKTKNCLNRLNNCLRKKNIKMIQKGAGKGIFDQYKNLSKNFKEIKNINEKKKEDISLNFFCDQLIAKKQLFKEKLDDIEKNRQLSDF